MKKHFWIQRILMVWLLSLALGCQLVQARENLKNCKFSLEDVGISSFSFTNMTLDFKVGIENSNASNVVVDRMDMDIILDGQDLGKGKTAERVEIPAGIKKSISVKLDTTMSQVGSSLLSALRSSGPIPYKINGTAYMAVPLVGEIPFPFTVEDKIEK